MKIIINDSGLFQANCYIAYDETSREGIIVDPGGDGRGIIETCKKNELNIKYIVLTHGHGDHIACVSEIKQGLDVKIAMSKRDEYLVQGGTQAMTSAFKNIPPFEIDVFIKDGDKIDCNGFSLEIIETPGHTPGGVCIKIEGTLFSGDTLFRGTVGRSDFEFASHEELIRSIKNKLLILPNETKVYPGHGGETTIGYEKKHNPFCS